VTPWTVASIHRILQARVLEGAAIPFSRESFQLRDLPKPGSPALQADSLSSEPPGKLLPRLPIAKFNGQCRVLMLTCQQHLSQLTTVFLATPFPLGSHSLFSLPVICAGFSSSQPFTIEVPQCLVLLYVSTYIYISPIPAPTPFP